MWSWEYALQILPQILEALKITVSATFVAFAVALVVGLLLTLARRSHYKLLSLFAQGFVEFVRNTPLLVQLYFIFYVLPEHGLALTPFLAGVIGLGLHYSTYLAEVYRGGIESVPPGQWEAAKALNFSTFETWKKVILPQSIPPVIPVMGNYLITMFKETPVLSAITLVEIMQTAKMLGSHSFRYLEAFTIVGALFLVLSYSSSLVVKSLEARLNLR
ncbi:ectoine/hydroxyectoine ABC transporter, permease protein EhuD [Desulfosporosinus orientis DSM 765]|uniref:Ectoine/hydroxyectoine ABC transporter, permease protein EhuD n=1 Tax=Desulfosporosinus orientis (strain ATCC 19365 / DSM 765 / NCIMB 8382 / VKM B-1628 / Singapore I) TaxID=768706 RepID=G7WF47_DESOD|nr:ectoine/hydroxyectoine ABC transporter permease subunit EhuD [Desulfosporosinus orientis]AET67658.1 ectoine/hydroxyectoine ABC transporter, permease protein EhuD [Desulfosporosinus orientis DSM 765]